MKHRFKFNLNTLISICNGLSIKIKTLYYKEVNYVLIKYTYFVNTVLPLGIYLLQKTLGTLYNR